MPVQKATTRIEKLTLPSTQKDQSSTPTPEDEWVHVEFDTSPLKAGDVSGVQQWMTEAEMGLAMVASRIKSWNYVDETTGLPLPITLETVKNLEMEDFTFLKDKMVFLSEGLETDQKKTSLDTLPQSETVSVRVD